MELWSSVSILTEIGVTNISRDRLKTQRAPDIAVMSRERYDKSNQQLIEVNNKNTAKLRITKLSHGESTCDRGILLTCHNKPSSCSQVRIGALLGVGLVASAVINDRGILGCSYFCSSFTDRKGNIYQVTQWSYYYRKNDIHCRQRRFRHKG